LAIAFGCAALVAAQEPPTQTTPSSPQTTTRGAQSGTITVTGCLQHGDMSATPGATGTTGGTTTAGTPPSRATSGSGSGASFILTNASSSASASTTGSTAGTTGATTPRSAASGTTYTLEGTASELSSMNVGKKVEVTGTLDTSSSSTTGTTGTTSATAPGSMSTGAAQKLRVSSVRVVGGDCSAEK